MRIPPLEPLNKHSLQLAKMVASTSWLPHPHTVQKLGRPAFPTQRARKGFPRLTIISENGVPLGMYDDNMTARWAILWGHGIVGGKRTGWGFAHVWPVSDDMGSYTHLANLVLVPECFASLTDKGGPLTKYLRWHSWDVYGWKPGSVNKPIKPKDYDQIVWRYLEQYDKPREFIGHRVMTLKNERVTKLRPIMLRLGMI